MAKSSKSPEVAPPTVPPPSVEAPPVPGVPPAEGPSVTESPTTETATTADAPPAAPIKKKFQVHGRPANYPELVVEAVDRQDAREKYLEKCGIWSPAVEPTIVEIPEEK